MKNFGAVYIEDHKSNNMNELQIALGISCL